MRSIAFADFLIGVGILFVFEGLLFAAVPGWMRRAMESVLAMPDNILRMVGIGSAVAGLILIGRSSGSRIAHEAKIPLRACYNWKECIVSGGYQHEHMSAAGFRRMMGRLGRAAKMPFPVHPHMLRHACGFKLANDGQDTRALQHYLGHKNIQHTVRYTELSPERFRDFWKD